MNYPLNFFLFFFFQAEDGIRDATVMEFRRVLFRSITGTEGPGVNDRVSRGNGRPPVANGLRSRSVRQGRRRNWDPTLDDLQEVATHYLGRVDRSRAIGLGVHGCCRVSFALVLACVCRCLRSWRQLPLRTGSAAPAARAHQASDGGK